MTKETMLNAASDESFSHSTAPSPDWFEFVPEISPTSKDIVITKKQWGTFCGTDLELQLRQRGMDTIVLCGIATDFGIESTARFAYDTDSSRFLPRTRWHPVLRNSTTQL